MKATHGESADRRISQKSHNRHLAPGARRHRPTTIVPDSFLEPLPKTVRKNRASKTLEVSKRLKTLLGSPYFEDDGFFLYHGDCVHFMEILAKGRFFVDLTVTSPPYNIGKDYEETSPVGKYVAWCSEWMKRVHGVTSPNGSFWLNVGYLDVPGKGLCVPIPYLLWDKSDFYLLQEVVWTYGAGVSSKKRLSPRNEKWLFYVKEPTNYTFNLDDIRDPNVKYPNQKKNGKFRCNPLGKNPSDVWDFPKVTTGQSRSSLERTSHPAQFPLRSVERVVKASSNRCQAILDPFAGSCSTGIASVCLGRIFIGFEKERHYCDLSTKRFLATKDHIRRGQSQEKLFQRHAVNGL